MASLTTGRLEHRPTQSPRDPAFVPNACGAETKIPNVDPSWIRCGTVTVPQNRADPNGPLAKIVLPVIIYQTPTSQSRSPLFFFAGGPGESAIDVLTEIFLPSPLGQLMLRERPIVAFNQRGIVSPTSGGSPDLGVLTYQWRANRDESINALLDSARKIAGRLRSRGVQPAYFSTRQTVEDAADVLRALGYERMVLFGTSYGTRVALEIMRVHPERVEASILDGVAPPQRNDSFDPVALGQRRRDVAARVVEDCERSNSCRSEYRELRKLASSLDRPDAPPVHLVVKLPSTGVWLDLDLSGRDLLSAVGAYAGTEFARAMPQMLEEFARGDTVRRPIAPELVLYVVNELAVARTAGPSYPVIYHAVLCGDLPSGVLQAGGRGVCAALGVPFPDSTVTVPVTSDVPTLMFSSEYDAQTPPDMAEEAARTLSNSYRILFPGIGHLAYGRPFTGSCVAVITNAFLLDTHRAPPDPCSTSLVPSFLPRSADIVIAPR
jgi:pimeloyl-ACP methyl ester carboxylesterase